MSAMSSTALWKDTTAITKDVAKKGKSLTQLLGGNAIIAKKRCGTRMHRDWPFAFLAMWASVMLAAALLALRYLFKLLQMSLTSPRLIWRPS
jgi:hypothetical protein